MIKEVVPDLSQRTKSNLFNGEERFKFIEYRTCHFYLYERTWSKCGLTFIEGESNSFIVELFSSTTIIAYSTSSPLCSMRKGIILISTYLIFCFYHKQHRRSSNEASDFIQI